MTQDLYDKRKFFKLKDERKLAYLEYGDRKNETIICVHGLTRNATDYHFFAKRLEHKYRIISIDIAGRGRSDDLTSNQIYSYESHLDDVLELLDFLQLKEVIWFGTSMGGILAMMLFGRNINIIKKLILNDIGPLVPMEATKRTMTYLSALPESFDSEDEIRSKIKDTFGLFGIYKQEHWDFFTINSIKQEKEKEKNKWCFLYDNRIVKDFDPEDKFNQTLRVEGLWNIWERINIPVLLIWGKLSTTLRNDTINRMRLGKSLVRIAVSDAGHTPHLMDKELNDIIFKWLDGSLLIEDMEISFKDKKPQWYCKVQNKNS